MSKENMHYTCIACTTIDSVLKINKKNHPDVYLEEFKYRVKKIQMTRFKNIELKSNSDSDSQLHSEKLGAKFDTKLMPKLASGPHNDSE